MWNRSFLILHGADERPSTSHWQYDLALRLRDRGERVSYPELPGAVRLEGWLDAIERALAALKGERIVVCHNLSGVAWLHLAARAGRAPADRVLLAAPPGPSAFGPDIAEFSPAPLDLTGLKLATHSTRLVCSVDDPHCPEVAAEVYGRPLACEVDLLTDGGSLSVADGYGRWPSVLDWCLDPDSRLGAIL